MSPDPRPSHASFWRENSLSLVFGALLLICLIAQAFVGLAGYNEAARTAGLQTISLARYVASASFAVDVAENWQSEYLQFTLSILLTIWLVQRGSSESKTLDQAGRESDEEQLLGDYATPDSPAWARAGRVAHNEERLRDLLDPLSLPQYLGSPDFWGRTLQNWQSELLAVGSMAVFAIYLRERGSPESRPVGAPHDQTGSA